MHLRKSNRIVFSIIFVALFTFFVCCVIPLHDANVATANEERVYLGGTPIGLDVKGDGLLLENFRPVITKDGTFNPSKDAGLLVGDIITHAGGNKISSPLELQKEIDKIDDTNLALTVLRGDSPLNFNVKPIFDPIAGSKKIGLIVKNSISGIGTMTFIDYNGHYCSLGHKICDINCKNSNFYQSGEIFTANILGTYKGENGEAGALKGSYDRNSSPIGSVTKNNEFGVYGKINEPNIYSSLPLVELGSKDQVKLGKAHIYSTINGKSPEKYEIEIVKAYDQNTPAVKSMVIRVTDRRLIEACGGIVQGMSGSPIIQDGKLVGAVTHVFLNDATIGYGVYIDWLK